MALSDKTEYERRRWIRAKSEVIGQYVDSVTGLVAQFASRGFTRPPGIVLDGMSQLGQRAKLALNDANLEILTESVDLEFRETEHDNTVALGAARFSIEAQVHALLVAFELEKETILTKYGLLKENVALYRAELDKRQAILIDGRTTIQAALDRLELELIATEGLTFTKERELIEAQIVTAEEKLLAIPLLVALLAEEALLIDAKQATMEKRKELLVPLRAIADADLLALDAASETIIIQRGLIPKLQAIIDSELLLVTEQGLTLAARDTLLTKLQEVIDQEILVVGEEKVNVALRRALVTRIEEVINLEIEAITEAGITLQARKNLLPKLVLALETEIESIAKGVEVVAAHRDLVPLQENIVAAQATLLAEKGVSLEKRETLIEKETSLVEDQSNEVDDEARTLEAQNITLVKREAVVDADADLAGTQADQLPYEEDVFDAQEEVLTAREDVVVARGDLKDKRRLLSNAEVIALGDAEDHIAFLLANRPQLITDRLAADTELSAEEITEILTNQLSLIQSRRILANLRITNQTAISELTAEHTQKNAAERSETQEELSDIRSEIETKQRELRTTVTDTENLSEEDITDQEVDAAVDRLDVVKFWNRAAATKEAIIRSAASVTAQVVQTIGSG